MNNIDNDFYKDLIDLLTDVFSSNGEEFVRNLLSKHWVVRMVLTKNILESLIFNGNSNN